MIPSSIQETKATEEALVKYKYLNNESETSTQNEDINDMDSALVKDKDNTCHLYLHFEYSFHSHYSDLCL